MTEMVTISKRELDRLESRARKTAMDKSYLQVIFRLMNRMNAAPGLDNTIENLLHNILDIMGGANLILYYFINGMIFYSDVYGKKMRLDTIRDPLVEKVFDTRTPLEIEHGFGDAKMTREFSKGYTWVFPLTVGHDLVGVLKMESMNIAAQDLCKELPPFFNYAALVLKNEIQGHTMLKIAYDQLNEKNRELRDEIDERESIQTELMHTKEMLEEIVQDRTSELRAANENLRLELIERKRAEEALRLHSEIIMNMQEGVNLVRERDFVIIYTNPKFEEMLGYDQNELIGKHISVINAATEKHPEKTAEEIRAAIKRDRVWSGEVLNVRKNGSTFWSAAIVSLYHHSEYGDVLITVQTDITDRKQSEAELKEYQGGLEALVRERTVELEIAKEQAESANKAKSVFLANMSHELRTPLNAILGFTQLLKRDVTLSGRPKADLNVIGRSGEHLLGLINDILELSKIEAGRMIVTETDFDFHAMLATIEEMIRIRATRKGLDLIFERGKDLPRFIRTDEQKLRQVLINLLNNAVKFTPVGLVKLRVRNEAMRLVFEVEDTGLGIARDDLDMIFEAFGQTGDGRKMDGSGLGLTLSRKIVWLLGGELCVASEVDKGSVFSFDIPLVTAKALEEKRSLRVVGLAPDQRDYRILVAEDKSDNRALLRRLLETVGFRVHVATNGAEAVEAFEKSRPHLIWMDIRMPVMNGYEAAKKIRETDKAHETSIIALTASPFEETKLQILSAGCDDYVRKPFREEEIFETMHRHLGVVYTYEETQTDAPDPFETVSDAVSTGNASGDVPESILSDLERATLHCDMGRLNDLIREIRKQDAPLGDTLENLAKIFDYDEIRRIVQTKKSGVERKFEYPENTDERLS